MQQAEKETEDDAKEVSAEDDKILLRINFPAPKTDFKTIDGDNKAMRVRSQHIACRRRRRRTLRVRRSAIFASAR